MVSTPHPMSSRKADRIFLGVVVAYFTIQTLLRTFLGGSFEVDEAEMIAMARDFRLGYGPQLPLYNWFQTAAFKLFGFNTFALTVTKNFLLCLTYAGAYLGLRQKLPIRLSLLGTMGLLLLPNLSFEGQRAGSHSIAMYAAMAWTLYILLRQWRAPDFGNWIALGLCLALGGLSKYNYWLFPLTLFLTAYWHKDLRRTLWRRELLISLAIAAAFVAIPYGWIATHMDQALSSTQKFYHTSSGSSLSPRQQGVVEFFIQSLVAILLTLLSLLVAWLPSRKALRRVAEDQGIGLWLIRAGALGLVISLIGVIASGSSDVQARWLLPALIPLSTGLMLWIGTALSARAGRNLLRFCAVLPLILIAAMADIRLRGAGSDSLMVEVLADHIEDACPDGPIAIDAPGYYYLGNLRYYHPNWFTPSTATIHLIPESVRCFVLVETADLTRVETLLQNYSVPASRLQGPSKAYTATLPYRFEDPDVTRDVPYIIIPLKNGAP
ncbi:hypothetical protein CEW89_10840 [Celeribacter ethanolicus]|uniref:Glycosyltransferase RgtA/B/C/D-like domain-containing protein n=1 Tax=Celeribacter ethanolicus TaxID=1758178 RepID=A0A291GD91_9RHOB|nr:glycosyltransferase family 39 protein [Celeribacter ethanolicus]ATG48012.1 hypothetical protein CEW89_10840 [Celeribacter ethanolicus]